MDLNHNFAVGQFTKLHEVSGGPCPGRESSFARTKERLRFDTPFDTKYDEACDEDTAFFGQPKMLQFSADSDEEEGGAVAVNLVEMVNTNDVQTSPFGIKRSAPRQKPKRPFAKSVTFDEKIREEFGLNCHSPKTPVSSMKSPGGLRGADCCSPAFRPHVSPLFDPTRTPNSNNNSCHLFDSGIFTPTPKNTPKLVLTTPSPTLSSSNKVHTRCMTSPVPLITYHSDEDEPSEAASLKEASMPSATQTPPHGRLTSLRLFGTPQTPQVLVERSQRRPAREPLRPPCLVQPDMSESNTELVKELNTPKVCLTAPKSCLRVTDVNCMSSGRRLDPDGPQVNVNPFVHNTNLRSGSKRGRPGNNVCSPMEQDGDTSGSGLPRKKLAMREMNTSRYREEFHEISLIGAGEFGSVFDCVNRLDGCHYAIKKSKSPVVGSINERNAMKEVYAHAVLQKHVHVVRYFSAWAEKGHMYIQNEFCNGGSLAGAIDDHRESGRAFTETELVYILVQTARGLHHIHSQGLVHLDIKPANLLIHKEPVLVGSSEEEVRDDVVFYETDVKTSALYRIFYKIADLGHVTSLDAPCVEEGDCRYLPVEVLQETYTDLTKADVFSLALTIYEAATLTELPKNGPGWHSIRECGLPPVAHLSTEFNNLLNVMSSYDPAARPSCHFLTQHPVLIPEDLKTRRALARELNLEKLKNQMLAQEIAEARRVVNEQAFSESRVSYTSRSSRLVGRSYPRSTSLTSF